jgi:hypothetical protein
VTTVAAPATEGQQVWFVALVDGRLVHEDGDADPSGLVDSVQLERPFRAQAVRRDGELWAVAARRIETIVLEEDPARDSVVLSWDGVGRTVRIDGEPTLVGVPELERLGASRHETYVVSATRLTGNVWDVSVAPL